MSASNFDNDAELLQRALAELRSSINERDAARRGGALAGSDLAGRIRDSTSKAEKLLEKVTAATRADSSSPLVTENEQKRRRDAGRRLAAELKQLRELDKKVVQSSNRDALGLDGAGGGGFGNNKEEAPRQTPDQLLLRSKEEFKVQDEVLDSLSRGLDGLKNLGSAISSETTLHMKLLDDLEEGVDKGDASLRREAARAEFVTRDAKTCWLYITICILLAMMCGLVSAPLRTHIPRATSLALSAVLPLSTPSLLRLFLFQIAFKFH